VNGRPEVLTTEREAVDWLRHKAACGEGGESGGHLTVQARLSGSTVRHTRTQTRRQTDRHGCHRDTKISSCITGWTVTVPQETSIPQRYTVVTQHSY